MLEYDFEKVMQKYKKFKKEHFETVEELNSLRKDIRYILQVGSREQVLEVLYTSDKDIADLAEILGVSDYEVCFLLNEAGIKRRKPKQKKRTIQDDKNKILELFDKGLSIPEINANLNNRYSYVTMFNFVKANAECVRTNRNLLISKNLCYKVCSYIRDGGSKEQIAKLLKLKLSKVDVIFKIVKENEELERLLHIEK